MPAFGTPKFSGLAVREISATFLNNGQKLEGKAAFIDTDTTSSYGWTRGEGAMWSKETVEALHTLRALMENDLASVHFSVVSVHTNSASLVPTSGTSGGPQASPGGLGEFLEEADQA